MTTKALLNETGVSSAENSNRIYAMGLKMSIALSMIQAGLSGSDKELSKTNIESLYRKNLNSMLKKAPQPSTKDWLFAVFGFWRKHLPIAMSFFTLIALVGALLIIYFAKARKNRRKIKVASSTRPGEISSSDAVSAPSKFSFLTNLFRKRKRDE